MIFSVPRAFLISITYRLTSVQWSPPRSKSPYRHTGSGMYARSWGNVDGLPDAACVGLRE